MVHTCFVISPIGEESSPTRKQADDLFELLIVPALEPWNFEVIRADKLPGSGLITSEIVQLVQNSDLCIIDLTSNNPNVFYECGRRHETGRPFIQIIGKGEQLPFDVAGIRTIQYDIEDPRSIRSTVQKVRDTVAVFEAEGFGERTQSTTLSGLAQSIDRLERKIERLQTNSLSEIPSTRALVEPGAPTSLRDIVNSLTRSPQEAIVEAVASGDLIALTRAFTKLVEQGADFEQTDPIAMLLATAGIRQGEDYIRANLESEVETRESDNVEPRRNLERLVSLVNALATAYIRYDRAEGSKIIGDLADQIITTNEDLSGEIEATLHNQVQRVAYKSDETDLALSRISRAISLNPYESSFWFNASLIYEKMGDLKLARTCIEAALGNEAKESDPDYLSQAVDVYVASDDPDQARIMLSRLARENPERYQRELIFKSETFREAGVLD